MEPPERQPNRKWVVVLARLALLGTVATAPSLVAAQREPQWFSAWTVAHNVGEVIPDLDNTTVRMIIRPTVAGQALRIKMENTRATTPVTFAAAFVGVTDTGAAVVPGTNTPPNLRWVITPDTRASGRCLE
jgi:hypothetical protein